MLVSLPPEPDNGTPVATSTTTTTNQRGTSFWLVCIAVALVVMLVGVVAGIGGYCGAGNCGGKASGDSSRSSIGPPTTTNVPNTPTTEPPSLSPISNKLPTADPTVVPSRELTTTPVRSPMTVAPTTQQQDLAVACNFLLLTNCTSCSLPAALRALLSMCTVCFSSKME